MPIPCLFFDWCDDGRVLVEVLHADGATTRRRIDAGHMVNAGGVKLAELRRAALTA